MRESSNHTYEFGPFHLEPAERRLLRNGEPVSLTPKAFDTLVMLVERAGHLVEKEVLMNALWPDSFVEEANVAQHVWTLRKTLGQHDGGAFIETVPKKGFRFVSPVLKHQRHQETLITDHQLDNGESVSAQPQYRLRGETAQTGHRNGTDVAQAVSRLSNRKIFLAILAAATLGLVVFGLSTRTKETAKAPPRTIAVLPFKPLSTDSRDESLEMGMAETLITRLSGVRQIIVRPMSAVRKYTDPQQDAIKAGQELQAEAVLDGSIQKSGDRVRVTVRLIDIRNGATLWAEQFDESFTDIFKVQDSTSARVTNALLLKLSVDEQKQLTKRYTDNAEAYQLYLQGEFLWYKWDQRSLEFYRRAAEKDPNFALAFVGIAESYMHLIGLHRVSTQEGIPKARAAITKALELDGSLAEAHNALAEIKYQFEYDWSGADKDFQRALELDPNSAQILLAYGWYRMSAGRFDEALVWMERARGFDRHNRLISYVIAMFYYFTRQYDKSLEHFQSLLMLEPNDLGGLGSIGDVYELKGMYAEAVESHLKSSSARGTLKPEEADRYRQIFKESGWEGYLRAKRARLAEKSKQEHVDPYEMAQLYARLGDKDRAFVWLEKAIDERGWVIQLKIEPLFDGLRSDSRYRDLLQRMNMTP